MAKITFSDHDDCKQKYQSHTAKASIELGSVDSNIDPCIEVTLDAWGVNKEEARNNLVVALESLHLNVSRALEMARERTKGESNAES